MTRFDEHVAWNRDHGLKENSHGVLFCPRCAEPHEETLTSDPKEPDYFHHVHQCTKCDLRFDVFLRTRSRDVY